MDRDVYVKLLDKLHDADEVIAGHTEDIAGLEEDVAGLEEDIGGLQPTITVIHSSVSGNTTVAGQSYTDIFTNLPAGKYQIVVNYWSTIQLIICKGNVGNSSNIFGDVSPGGVVYLDISEATTIKMYANTDDTSDVSLIRVRINAIKIG